MAFRYHIQSANIVEFEKRIKEAEQRNFRVVTRTVVDHAPVDTSGFHNFVGPYGSRRHVAVMERRENDGMDGRI